ncbi:MAG: DUF3047 domain-containing protein [Rhodobacteraceae bacterium]|nr:DUF3047 domain-containing protein [Paracoccaceae bacterium]
MAFQPVLAVAAEAVAFDGSWKEQGFLRLFSNDYIQRGRQLDVISDGTVSLLWRPVDRSHRFAEAASWAWRVREGVSATDLTVKGGDDRNLSVYFVFVNPDRAEALSGGNARRILREGSARGLIYVWGGAHEAGSVLQSPYSSRLRTKILRVADTGEHREDVDLEDDFRTAFGDDPGALIGLAISADSDDTDGRIVASIADLVLN